LFASQHSNSDTLDATEMAVVDKLCIRFAQSSSWDLVELSHKEDGWKALKERKELISYQEYAFGLRGV